MAQITLTIPNDKLSRITDALESLYPIPADDADVPLFTSNQWAKEVIKRFIKNKVLEHEKAVARRAAVGNMKVDDGLVS